MQVKRFGSEYPEVSGNIRQVKLGLWFCASKQIHYKTAPNGKPLKLFWSVRIGKKTYWL